MKKLFFILFLIFVFCTGQSFAAQSFDEKKKEIIALYNSNNLEAAYKQISTITEDERDFEIWYLIANLYSFIALLYFFSFKYIFPKL